ncbi:MAG: FIST N-terminal domain-containing protein [Phycisphaerales bacterium JB064]
MSTGATSAIPATLMASGLSSLDRTEHAARQALEQAAEQLPQGPASANLAFVFFSSAHVGQAGLLASAARAELPNATIVGCSAESVLGGSIELEDRPGVSVLACSMPGVDIRAFPLTRLGAIDPANPNQVERVRELAGMTHEHRATFLLPDPFGLPTGRVISAVDKAARLGLADDEHPVTLGGLASADNSAGGNAFLLDGKVIRDGGVGLSINGQVTIDTVVSQGCKPLGPNMVVTQGRGNIVSRLGGRPAFETIREVIADLDEDEKQMLSRGVFLGVVADEHRRHFGRGDYIIRSIMSANEADGSIALSDYVRLGQTVRLHARDAGTAHEDLELLLDAQKLHDHPAGCLLITCNGRGTRLFEQPNHDASTVRRAFEAVRKGTPAIGAAPRGTGHPMPIAGFFAAGEIGPIQGRTFLHGHTACVALFRQATA